MKRFEPPLNRKGTNQFKYFNDEWNPPLDDDDSGHEDFVDSIHPPKQDTTYYDDYEDYGH